MPRNRPNRRRFLAGSVAAAAGSLGLTPLSLSVRGQTRQAVGRLRIGVVGCGVRGKYLIGNLPDTAVVTAICDCAPSRIAGTLEPRGEFAAVLAGFRERDAAGCATYADY